MTDLSTTYMGLKLHNPLVVASSSLTGNLDGVKQSAEAGAGAIVLKSLFEEQIEMERYKLEEELTRYDDLYAEMLTIHPHIEHSGPDEHLMLLQKARDEISIPVIASLNAVHRTTWCLETDCLPSSNLPVTKLKSSRVFTAMRITEPAARLTMSLRSSRDRLARTRFCLPPIMTAAGPGLEQRMMVQERRRYWKLPAWQRIFRHSKTTSFFFSLMQRKTA